LDTNFPDSRQCAVQCRFGTVGCGHIGGTIWSAYRLVIEITAGAWWITHEATFGIIKKLRTALAVELPAMFFATFAPIDWQQIESVVALFYQAQSSFMILSVNYPTSTLYK